MPSTFVHFRLASVGWLLAGMLTLAGCGKTEVYEGQTLREWIEALNTRDINEHAQAIDDLVRIGLPAREALIAGLKNEDNEIRGGCATALLRIDPSAVEHLERVAAEGDLRCRVRLGLGMIRANVQPGRGVEWVAEGVEFGDEHVRSQAIRMFTWLGPESTEAVPALVKLVESESHTLRRRGINGLLRIGPGAAAATPALIAALEHPDSETRTRAAEVLGAIGAAAEPALPALAEAREDQSPEVRLRASQACEKITAALQDTRRS